MARDFRAQRLITLVRTFDLALVCATFVASLAISSNSLTWPGFTEVFMMRVKVGNFVLFAGYLAFYAAVFSACGLYRSHRLSLWQQRLHEMLMATAVGTGALLLLKQFLVLEFATNAFFLLFWFLTFGTLMLSHEVALRLLSIARLRGRNLRNIIIVGEGLDANALANHVRQDASLGYRVLRIIDTRGMTEDGWIAGDS